MNCGKKNWGSFTPSFAPRTARKWAQSKPLFYLCPVIPPSFAAVVLANTLTSGFWLRSSHGSSNPNHSKEQSSRVKSSKARGRGAQERLRYSTDKAVGHLHSSVALPHDQGFPTALAAPRMQFFLLCQYNRLPESRRQLQPYKDA